VSVRTELVIGLCTSAFSVICAAIGVYLSRRGVDLIALIYISAACGIIGSIVIGRAAAYMWRNR